MSKTEEKKPNPGTSIRLIAIIGANKVGLSDRAAKLLTTLKIPIIIRQDFPDMGLAVALVDLSNKKMYDKAIREAKPMPRKERRVFIKKMEGHVVIADDKKKVDSD